MARDVSQLTLLCHLLHCMVVRITYTANHICKMLQVRGVQVTRGEHLSSAMISWTLSLRALQVIREMVHTPLGCILGGRWHGIKSSYYDHLFILVRVVFNNVNE